MFGLGNNAGLDASKNANQVASGYGANAATASSQLMPFLTRELNNPQGFTQQQQGAMLGASEAGAGGATAGLNTEANLASARDRNSGGFSGALDQAARTQGKNVAGISEGIAGQNVNLQQQQQQEAAKGLQGEQGMDQEAQLKALGLVPEDINAQANLNAHPNDWASQLMRGAGAISSAAGSLGFGTGM